MFDIYEDQFDRFMDNFDHINSSEAERIDFIVDRCQELPELAEDDPSGGQSWRNDNDNDYSRPGNRGGGGGYRGGNDYRGGRGGMRGSRGGFDNYQQPQMQKYQSYEPEP